MDPADPSPAADDSDHQVVAGTASPSHPPFSSDLKAPSEDGPQIQHPASSTSRLLALPAELIANILSHLTPADLAQAAQTCRFLYQHATDDLLWAAHVQDNVPGHAITTPYPCPSFYALFGAHHPRWFLTRHKLWFADTGLAGRLVLARYDQRRGCIEGYQLIAWNRTRAVHPWAADPRVRVSSFLPHVALHLDSPVLQLAPEPYASDHASEEGPVVLERHHDPDPNPNPDEQQHPQGGLAASSVTRRPLGPHPPGHHPPPHSFRSVIHMGGRTLNYIQQSFVHAKRLPPEEVVARRSSATGAAAFPYGHVWPPPSIPSPHHVLGAGLERPQTLRAADRAAAPREVCQHAFRVHKWLQIHRLQVDFQPNQAPLPTAIPAAIGEEVSTYATLSPSLYTPTPLRPLRGIFVGDYSAHGGEFLLLHQPPLPDPLPPPPPRHEDESDEGYETRCRERLAYSGRVEAIKLTGDSNVPRGEVSFFVEDVGEVAGEVEVDGVERVRWVRGKGHVADNGFMEDRWMDTQLLLISEDRLAHVWRDLRHMSFYQRVDIDQFLVPN